MTGQQLRILREFYGYDTQTALAEALNVHAGTVQLWESADTVSEKTQFQLKKVLHWNIPYMLNILNAEHSRVRNIFRNERIHG